MYLVVRGDSMLPTYQNGDLLMIMKQDGYSVGEAAAYRVPADEVGAGRIVVHRVTEIEDGQYTCRATTTRHRIRGGRRGRTWLAQSRCRSQASARLSRLS